MKISKQMLKQIIKEELEQVQASASDGPSQESGDTKEQDIQSKSEFSKKLREVSLQVSKMNLDAKEVQVIDSILAALLVFANENSGATKLSILQDKLKPILGIK